MPKIFPKNWDSKEHEQKIYDDWENSGSFAPEINMGENPEYSRADKKPFVISIPPPNITGKLHVGHALFVAIEDLMIRYHRHLGEPALWVPGTDHEIGRAHV